MVSTASTLTEIDRPLLILYATETGNAYDVAQSVLREAIRRHFQVSLASVDEYPVVSASDVQGSNYQLKCFSR